jgi:hypothetical protein
LQIFIILPIPDIQRTIKQNFRLKKQKNKIKSPAPDYTKSASTTDTIKKKRGKSHANERATKISRKPFAP